MVDWRVLQKWHIKPGRLPVGTIMSYRPTSLWEEHKILIIFVVAGLLAQAFTIIALLVLRGQQRRAVAEIEKQRTELAHVSRVSTMGQLASALTHELNQPLGAILRNAEAAELFLQSSPPNLEEVRAILTDIRRDDKRAGNVIDRMRALYKRRSLVLQDLDLRELVEDTVALTRTDADTRQVRITMQMPPQLPRTQGDRVHLQQVLLNLILNGMDSMATVSKPRRILLVRVQATKSGNLQIEITDHGTGIAPEAAARIFEPFFTTKSNGMGMGLAISQTIIEAHGGDIWVDSKGGAGTTFTLILPPAGVSKVKEGDLPASL
jgi:signal transduction histidine kinase